VCIIRRTTANIIPWNGCGEFWKTIGTGLSWIQSNIILERVKSMTWKGIRPAVQLLDKTHESGKKLSVRQMEAISKRFVLNILVPKWDVTGAPATGQGIF